MRVLGIETSCDDTGVAIYDYNRGLLANYKYSQGILHSKYGGIVPELAAREHVNRIISLILSALRKVNSNHKNSINGIAYTAGPGLIGSLLVGATVARALAYAWKIPAIGVHHMEAHLLAPMIENINITKIIKFPFISLLVSGGHTQLVLVKSMGEYKILGESLDDAVGEVFDKIAVLLGLKYPGGELLSKIAQTGSERYKFPRPMVNKPGFNFSFSGLKTAVARVIMSSSNDQQTRADIAYSFQSAVIETLIIKCRRAISQNRVKQLVVSGGVSANTVLRSNFEKMMHSIKGRLFIPKLEFCVDNGAMIAYTGLMRLQSELYTNNNSNNGNLSIIVKPRWSLESLSKI